ncbi:MAG: HIT family protein [Propionibacteriaceae bacterium]
MAATDADPCVFCKIISGEVGSRQVYADDDAIAFLDLAPFQPGHALVVPREHVASMLDGQQTMARLGPAIETTARLLVSRLDAQGINLLCSAGEVAGQEVFHLHVHLIPRYADRPGLRRLFESPKDAATEEALDAVLARVRNDRR